MPANIDLLRATIHTNALENRVRVYPFALGDHDDVITINVEGSGRRSDNATLAKPSGRTRRATAVPIEMRTLDGVLDGDDQTGPIAVMKIDVEGAEVGVLRGARNTLTASRPLIVGEFHSGLMPLYDSTFLDAYEILEPLGYRVFSFGSHRSLIEEHPRVGLGDVALIPDSRLDAAKLDLTSRGWHVQLLDQT